MTQTNKYEFKKSLVAYLDILGFKELAKCKDMQDKLLDIQYELREKNSPCKLEISGSSQAIMSRIQPDISSFSDHTIISIPLNFSEFPKETDEKLAFSILVSSIVLHINLLYKHLLLQGIVFRGAIAVGDVYFDQKNGIGMGAPLFDTIKDEATLAIYPRVIVSKSLLSFANSFQRTTSGDSYSHGLPIGFRRDFDGMYYVDYLQSLFLESMRYANIPPLNVVRQKIYDNIEKHEDELNILQKWYWLANYFDTTLIYWKNSCDSERKLKYIYPFGLLDNNFY